MFSTTQAGGLDVGGPDVCKVPPAVPVPFPNMAEPTMAVGAAYTILNGGAPAHNLGTVIPITMGDNAGVLGGVVSGTEMGPSRRITAAFTILLDGMPATRLTSMGTQNAINTVGVTIAPSQTTVLYLAP